jgi:Phosphatidate cytidylyltransferase, mitochondrial
VWRSSPALTTARLPSPPLAQVDDPVAWHAANLERNAGHYSWLASTLAGPRGLVAVANTVGAGVHFNPFVRLNATMVRACVRGRCR